MASGSCLLDALVVTQNLDETGLLLLRVPCEQHAPSPTSNCMSRCTAALHVEGCCSMSGTASASVCQPASPRSSRVRRKVAATCRQAQHTHAWVRKRSRVAAEG